MALGRQGLTVSMHTFPCVNRLANSLQHTKLVRCIAISDFSMLMSFKRASMFSIAWESACGVRCIASSVCRMASDAATVDISAGLRTTLQPFQCQVPKVRVS